MDKCAGGQGARVCPCLTKSRRCTGEEGGRGNRGARVPACISQGTSSVLSPAKDPTTRLVLDRKLAPRDRVRREDCWANTPLGTEVRLLKVRSRYCRAPRGVNRAWGRDTSCSQHGHERGTRRGRTHT
jgi:hypothetical protein